VRIHPKSSATVAFSEANHGIKQQIYINNNNVTEGLKTIHKLTKTGNYELRFDMEDFENDQRYAQYRWGSLKKEGNLNIYFASLVIVLNHTVYGTIWATSGW